MSPAAFSIRVFSVHVALCGLLQIILPREACRLIGLQPPSDILWVRISGMLLLVLAYYYFEASRTEEVAFFRRSVVTRLSVLPFLVGFVAFAWENWTILAFGVIDLFAALWTALALRNHFEPKVHAVRPRKSAEKAEIDLACCPESAAFHD